MMFYAIIINEFYSIEVEGNEVCDSWNQNR